jgi:hypothetical protein
VIADLSHIVDDSTARLHQMSHQEITETFLRMGAITRRFLAALNYRGNPTLPLFPRYSQSSSTSVGVLDRQTYRGGTRGSRLCGDDRDWETENSKVCARTRDTRFIQVRAAKVANPTSCLGDQVWRPALGVG